ncbi:merR family regulatory protein [bacterium BMS3Abin02]|nr:merR family regulatory protein [bacterium BMS3Abin02]GBE23719.1 merR family regulatory protein [bacterium BMS3Bbin01]HDH25945.1 MerR family transcriptional regulator [Actinomycetota bacterium]
MSEGASIGEVITLLKDEFPDLTVSKVRFLEGRGLINPRRSTSGYRSFSDEDVARLRYILQQQRDHFLPLKVIKSKLTMWERGEEMPIPAPGGPPPEQLFQPAGQEVDRNELRRVTGLSSRQLSDLIDSRVVRPEEGKPERYSAEEVAIATQAQRLLAYGLEARHLRPVRISSERDAELLEALTAALLRARSPEARQRAAETLAGCADAIAKMRSAALSEELRALMAAD